MGHRLLGHALARHPFPDWPGTIARSRVAELVFGAGLAFGIALSTAKPRLIALNSVASHLGTRPRLEPCPKAAITKRTCDTSRSSPSSISPLIEDHPAVRSIH